MPILKYCILYILTCLRLSFLIRKGGTVPTIHSTPYCQTFIPQLLVVCCRQPKLLSSGLHYHTFEPQQELRKN